MKNRIKADVPSMGAMQMKVFYVKFLSPNLNVKLGFYCDSSISADTQAITLQVWMSFRQNCWT